MPRKPIYMSLRLTYDELRQLRKAVDLAYRVNTRACEFTDAQIQADLVDRLDVSIAAINCKRRQQLLDDYDD